VDYDPNPQKGDPISIARSEYDEVYDRLRAANLPLKPRDQAWEDFAGWRVNYDTPLLALAALTMAPQAMWSSDRSLFRRRKRAKHRQSHIDNQVPPVRAEIQNSKFK
jgi:hypothetical protein